MASARAKRARFAWCLFDWANSPFPTVVITFVFAAYFTQGIVGDPVRGAALWGNAMAASALAVALLAPVMGAIADAGGRRKPWLAACTAVTVLGALLLWYAAPDPGYALWALVWVAIANVGFELGMVFYNALLPGLAAPGRLGRLSARGWATGYAGGLVCLAIALVVFVRAEPPPFGLDPARAEQVRIVAPLAALWFAAFAWPLFVFVPDAPPGGRAPRAAVRAGFARLAATLRDLRGNRVVARFLLARLLYIDGLNTIFAFGGIYAAGSFDMPLSEVILFGIALNVTAGIGAFAFGWVDDRLGAKRTLIIALVGLIASGAVAVLAPDVRWLWGAALVLGLFIGPVQSSSRTMMARLAPAGKRAEMFGLFALSGRVTAFAGPALVAWVTLAFDSQRAGMASTLVFLVLGLGLLIGLRAPESMMR